MKETLDADCILDSEKSKSSPPKISSNALDLREEMN
jgi:hypothetical protein